MKRIFALTLTIIMVFIALSGCMASKKPSGNESNENSSKRKDEQNETDSYPADQLHPLYEKYPEYWDLDGMKGIEVYVWETADGGYRCGALSGTNRLKTDEEIKGLFANGATFEEMKTILELCEVAKEHVSIVKVSNLLDDNWKEIDINDESLLRIQALFWGE